MSRSRAHRLIAASEAVEMLPIGNKTTDKLPTNEAQVRPLTSIEDPEEKRDVWERAVKKAEEEERPVSARHVEEAKQEENGPPGEEMTPMGAKTTDKLPASDLHAQATTVPDLARFCNNYRRWCIAPYLTPRGHARVLLADELIGSLSSGVTI